MHSFIVASFNAQSVKGNDMACMRCEISTFMKDNDVDLYFVNQSINQVYFQINMYKNEQKVHISQIDRKKVEVEVNNL